MRQLRRWSPLMALILVLAPGAASGRDAPAGVSKPTGAALKLMVVYEGVGSVTNPEAPEGAIAAAKAINAAGGIKGRPIQIIACDTKSDPTTATGCGRRAVSEGVVAIVGSITLFGGRFMPLM